VEHQAHLRLARMGFQVARTGYNDPWDLRCEGVKVEVKGATYRSRRYQAAIRNHQADVLLFGCKRPQADGGDLVFFVIPARAYAHTNNIAVWTRDPADYQGQWCEYYRAWWLMDAIVSRLPAYVGWQPALFQEIAL
ncbi:MAG: hypothetical protein PVF45_14605, partial [Anaerolineae bacterium]